MVNVLFVKVNPKADTESASTTLANYFLEQYKVNNPKDTIEKLDLYNEDIPFLDVDVFSAWGKFAEQKDLTDVETEKVARMDKLTNQFLQADKVIFAAPFWNLSYPPMLKAYIDTICISGKTFEYTEEGPVGLVEDKPVLIIETRGGFYSEGPTAEMEHSLSYLKTILGFIGIKSIHAVIAELLDVDDAHREKGLAGAKGQLDELVQEF